MPTLNHALVTCPGATPTRWLLFLHGIFGTGANWRTFARRCVDVAPSWGAVLVDLRMHGNSQGFAPPHTIAQAAADLVALEGTLRGPVRGVLGHSFGGKVALAYVRATGEALDHAWVIDAMPGVRADAHGSESTLRILGFLETLRGPFATRDAFVQAMLARGITADRAQWLAMNLRSGDAGYALHLDLGAIRALLEDYLATDLWPVLEAPPGHVTIDVLVAGRSTVFEPSDRARIETIAAHSGGRVRVRTIPDAAHWVHVDDPEATFAWVCERLR